MKKQMDPRMHSAEHILNQAMDRIVGCGRCFSAHIERKKSKCDYRVAQPVAQETLAAVAEEVNRVIAADLPVVETFLSKEEADGAFDLSRLPQDAGQNLRIIAVGDYDRCPCIGVHVSRTGEIGAFRITSSSQENGVLRIRFKLSAPA
jgi:misacylated tRNA(Ala) deacylase